LYKYSPIPEHIDSASRAKKERNDCAVKAFAIVMNTSYDRAHKHLSLQCGRQHRKHGPIQCDKVLPESLKNTKHRVGPYAWVGEKVTIKKFCDKHPIGRYFVLVRGHAIAIIDGIVYDWGDKPRRQIYWAMRVYLD
jgi:hypothetical protein